MKGKFMDIDSLKQKYKNRDRFIRVMTKDGHFRAVAIRNSETAKIAQQKHNLSHIPAVFLGRALAAASMLAAFLKGEERISIDLSGNGPISKVFAEALQVGEVRGYVNTSVPQENIQIDRLTDALGEGNLKVVRILYNRNEPIQGIVPLANGDIASDLANYFINSEQIPSAVLLDCDIDNNGMISQSGGIIVQAMPGAKNEEIEKVVYSLAKLKSICDLYAKDISPEELLSLALPYEYDILKTSPVDFYCRCSKEIFKNKLMTLNIDEIQGMKDAGENELTCHYCNEHYYLEDKDFDDLLTNMKAKQN